LSGFGRWPEGQLYPNGSSYRVFQQPVTSWHKAQNGYWQNEVVLWPERCRLDYEPRNRHRHDWSRVL